MPDINNRTTILFCLERFCALFLRADRPLDVRIVVCERRFGPVKSTIRIFYVVWLSKFDTAELNQRNVFSHKHCPMEDKDCLHL